MRVSCREFFFQNDWADHSDYIFYPEEGKPDDVLKSNSGHNLYIGHSLLDWMKFCLTDLDGHSRRGIYWLIVLHWLRCHLHCCCFWKIFVVGFDVPSPYWQLYWGLCTDLLFHEGVLVECRRSTYWWWKCLWLWLSHNFLLILSKCCRIVPPFHPFSVSSRKKHSDQKWCCEVDWKLFPSFPKVWKEKGHRSYHGNFLG